jgi:hypothetical protein
MGTGVGQGASITSSLLHLVLSIFFTSIAMGSSGSIMAAQPLSAARAADRFFVDDRMLRVECSVPGVPLSSISPRPSRRIDHNAAPVLAAFLVPTTGNSQSSFSKIMSRTQFFRNSSFCGRLKF